MREENPGVHYRFNPPLNRDPLNAFAWHYSSWSRCSALCAGGNKQTNTLMFIQVGCTESQSLTLKRLVMDLNTGKCLNLNNNVEGDPSPLSQCWFLDVHHLPSWPFDSRRMLCRSNTENITEKPSAIKNVFYHIVYCLTVMFS